MDSFLREDLDYIADSSLPFEELYHSTVLVTGATGLVGSQVVRALLNMNDKKAAGIRVVALVRNQEKAKSIFADEDTSNLRLLVGDVTSPVDTDMDIDYIIHAASPTASKFFVEHPVETIMTAVEGTRNMLELARSKATKGMVYLSSMEAYGITDSSLDCVREEDLGYIDVLNVRSSYSEGKRICECLCASYASEYGVNVKIARLAQTFGAGISKDENRVFAQFAKSAIGHTDIVLHTLGQSVGNYCYTRDVVMAVLLLLIRGNSGEAYTVANEESSTTIADMAHMVAKEFGEGQVNVVFDIPEDVSSMGYAPDVKMKLNSDKLQSLGWKPEVSLRETYERMIGSLRALR